MGAFGSCLGVGRPVRPGANPRLLGSNLVGVDTRPFAGGMTGPHTNGRHPPGSSGLQRNPGNQPNHKYLLNGKDPTGKLLRQSSGLSGGQNVVTKLVDIDDNPLDRTMPIGMTNNNPANSQLICNNGKQQNNKQLSISISLSSAAAGAGANANGNGNQNQNQNNNNNSNNNNQSVLGAGGNSPSAQMSQAVTMFVQNIRANPNEVRELVGLYNYDARTNEDLAFSKGEHMETTESLMLGEWWLARSKSTNNIGWVPKNYVAVLKSKAQLNCEPWYFGRIGRNQSELRLKSAGNDDGAFIIRDSDTTTNQYSLSLLHENSVKHYRIRQFNLGGFYINKNNIFSTIHDLVESYSVEPNGLCVKLGKPCQSWMEQPATVGLSYDTCDAWEIDRNKLTLGRELGHGQFGTVYEGVFNNQGKHLRVAIKTLRKGSMDPKEFLEEAQIMKKMRHENLVQLYAVCTREEPIYIITEVMSKGALISYLASDSGKALPLAECVNMATQIANGMSYLEKEKYVHRDLAARNILVGEQNVCKIADFGLARFLKEEEYEARPGARFPIKWTAPEAALYSKFTIKSDVWSFGIVLYEIITKGEVPYKDMHNTEVLNLIDKNYRMPRPPNCEVKYYDIMLKCWHKDPLKRPTFEALHWKLGDYFLSDEQYRDAQDFLRIK